jgi:hypothetical protein
MKSFGRLFAVAVVICALPLMTGCASSSQQDSTAQQSAQSEPAGAAAPATDAPARPQDESAQAPDSSVDSVAGDIWEVITFPFRVVGDIVGFIL